MRERESTASNIATDLLGRLNNKLRSELVRHVDEYFQKTDFQNILAFPNVHESNTLDGLHQDSGNTQAVENLGPQAHQGADGQNTENPPPLAENVEIEGEKSNSKKELTQDVTPHRITPQIITPHQRYTQYTTCNYNKSHNIRSHHIT